MFWGSLKVFQICKCKWLCIPKLLSGTKPRHTRKKNAIIFMHTKIACFVCRLRGGRHSASQKLRWKILRKRSQSNWSFTFNFHSFGRWFENSCNIPPMTFATPIGSRCVCIVNWLCTKILSHPPSVTSRVSFSSSRFPNFFRYFSTFSHFDNNQRENIRKIVNIFYQIHVH